MAPVPHARAADVANGARTPSARRAPGARLPLPRWRWVAMGGVALATAVGLSAVFWPESVPPPQVPAPPRLAVAGKPLLMKGDPAAEALDSVRRFAAAELVLVFPDGKTRALRPAELGAEIHRVKLATFVHEALEPGSALRRAYERRRATEPNAALAVPVPLQIDAERALAALVRMKDEVDHDAADAAVNLEKRSLKPEEYGYRLDIYATLGRIESALARGDSQVVAAVEKIVPRVLASSLGDLRFDDVLGYFETRYTPGKKYQARVDNLRVAASKLDGTVLMPGEVFDFNRTVGPRDEAHGYKVAPVIAQGELVDGIGGGTCQISGTLHGAAFFAGLDIVEHYAHTRPSYYIKLGLDATVVYPNIDFRFKNPFDFPIVLHETVKDYDGYGVVRAEILGPKRRRTVTFFRRLDGVVPFEELERPTDKLPEGKRILVQRGLPGFKATLFRVVRDGAYAVRDKRQSVYPPTTQIVDVGTGPKELEVKRRDDSHPEYVTDAYLVITQGPDIRTPGTTQPELGGGTVESRVPGLTGKPGWQAKWGMKVFEAAAADGEHKDDDAASGQGPDGEKGEPAQDEGNKKKKKKSK